MKNLLCFDMCSQEWLQFVVSRVRRGSSRKAVIETKCKHWRHCARKRPFSKSLGHIFGTYVLHECVQVMFE